MSASTGRATGPLIPRGAVIGAASLIAFTLATATLARVSDVGTTRMPDAPVLEERLFRFADRADGAIAVTDMRTGRIAAVVPPGTNGFIRGTLRGLARERKLRGVGIEPPFLLLRRAGGRLSLEDPETGRVVNLEVFGPTNADAFAHLLTVGGTMP